MKIPLIGRAKFAVGFPASSIKHLPRTKCGPGPPPHLHRANRIAVGTTLVFRSYLLMGVAAVSIATHLWWAAAEEKLLSSPDGLGHAYRTYASRTGRFLPRVRRARRRMGSL